MRHNELLRHYGWENCVVKGKWTLCPWAWPNVPAVPPEMVEDLGRAVSRLDELLESEIARVSQVPQETLVLDSPDSPKEKETRPSPEKHPPKPASGNALETLLDKEGQKIMEIAHSTKSADDKMHEVVRVDSRFLAWDSERWGRLLDIKGSAVRKTRFWKETRKQMIGKDQPRMIAEDQARMIAEDQAQSEET
jgi:hypothetical protein